MFVFGLCDLLLQSVERNIYVWKSLMFFLIFKRRKKKEKKNNNNSGIPFFIFFFILSGRLVYRIISICSIDIFTRQRNNTAGFGRRGPVLLVSELFDDC